MKRIERKNRMSRLLLVLTTLLTLTVGAAAGESNNQSEYGVEKDVSYLAEHKPATVYQIERCRLDLYYPQNEPGFATVVWFHGGGLKAGNRHIPTGLRNQGLAVAAVNYRLSPKATCPAYIQDAAAAVAWTLRHIDERGGDPNKVFVSGHSAPSDRPGCRSPWFLIDN
jgi:acetyl esterase/lipase